MGIEGNSGSICLSVGKNSPPGGLAVVFSQMLPVKSQSVNPFPKLEFTSHLFSHS